MSAPGADPLAAIRQRVDRAILSDLDIALAQLRHAYENLYGNRVSRRGMQEFADGVIAPQIRRLEHHQQQWDTHQSALRALVADMQDRIDYMHRDTDWYRAQELEYWKRKVERLLSGPQP